LLQSHVINRTDCNDASMPQPREAPVKEQVQPRGNAVISRQSIGGNILYCALLFHVHGNRWNIVPKKLSKIIIAL
jgi:hypothetical protein